MDPSPSSRPSGVGFVRSHVHGAAEPVVLPEDEPPPSARPPLWRIWLLATRPHTLGASMVPVCVGASLALREGAFSARVFAVCTLAALALQVCTNLANDAFDHLRQVDTAERIGPVRVTQAGWLSAGQVFGGVALSIAIALAAGIELVTLGGWPILAIGLVSIAAALAYSGGPFPLASNGLGELAAFVFFGVIAVVGSHYLHTLGWSADALWCAVPIGLLVSAIMLVNNLRDLRSDALCGKRTLAVRIGAVRARQLYALLIGTSLALCGVVAWRVGAIGALLPLFALPLGVRAVRTLRVADGASSFHSCLAQTARLHAVYGALLCLGLIL